MCSMHRTARDCKTLAPKLCNPRTRKAATHTTHPCSRAGSRRQLHLILAEARILQTLLQEGAICRQHTAARVPLNAVCAAQWTGQSQMLCMNPPYNKPVNCCGLCGSLPALDGARRLVARPPRTPAVRPTTTPVPFSPVRYLMRVLPHVLFSKRTA